MAKFVIKSDNSKEPFDLDKIKASVESAAEDAGLESDEISELIDEMVSFVSNLVEDVEEISTEDIRREILDELDEIDPDVHDAWIEYDEQRGKN